MPKHPSVAIVIGSYKAPDFIRLNIKACRRVFGDDCPILISDDHSGSSGEIEGLADEEGCHFAGSSQRRSHCSGDWQAFINGAVFGRQAGAEICLKLSQRFVPVDHRFRDMVLAPFDNPNVAIVFPPKMDKKHLARPGIGLYTQFSMLTDCLAWRTSEIDPDMLLRVYVERQKTGHRLSTVPECAWAQIADEQFHGRTVGVDKLSNPDLFEPKAYLRKASAIQSEYMRLAEDLGIKGGNYDLREWNAQEGANYLVRPVVVNELKTS